MNHNKTKDRMSAVEKALAPVMEKMAQMQAPAAQVPPMAPQVPVPPPQAPVQKETYCNYHAQFHQGEDIAIVDDGGECRDCVSNNEAKYDKPDPDVAQPMNFLAWVNKNCKFAQAVPQPAPMGSQMAGGGMESIVRELAQQLAQRSTMAPISQMDVRQGIMKMMQNKGLAMPQGGDLEGFVGSVMDAIQGMGGQVAQVQQDQPQAAATPFDARPNREKAPMDPDMSSWYNNSRMSRQPSGGMGQR